MDRNSKLVSALRENTKAVRENSTLLRRLTADNDKETQREQRRRTLVEGGPYTEDELMTWKRPDLVMYAAQIGVRNTSVPQKTLVGEVLKHQTP